MIRATCRACGRDCSRMYATFKGEPYHFGCLPVKTTRTVLTFEGEEYELKKPGEGE